MPGTVSVIIPAYNYGRFLGEAIDSVFGQTYPITEIAVIDSASEDETQAVLAGYSGRVKNIRQANMGVCEARNRGVAETTAEYIAFLDADDTWHPAKIEKQMAKFATDAEIGLVHCGMREFADGTGETIKQHLNGGEGWIADNLLLWQTPAIIGPGGTIIVKRSIFEEVGGFDPRLIVGEDWDFCYRVAREHKIGFVGEPLVDYRNHGANAHKNVSEMERGMALMYEKAFATDDSHVLGLKSRAYGNFHRTLAGSYLHAGDYYAFVRHSIRSLINRPSNIGYFLKFPFRRFTRSGVG
ncbi:MAG: glycosyltransferase [Pyrinomonadaceae bacterium]